MQSRIDWNEIVPRLDAGLRQTLYLEAVKLISERGESRVKYQRDYQAEYYRRTKKTIKRHRTWTPAAKRRVVEYYKQHGWTATIDKYDISSSMIGRWKKTIEAK